MIIVCKYMDKVFNGIFIEIITCKQKVLEKYQFMRIDKMCVFIWPDECLKTLKVTYYLHLDQTLSGFSWELYKTSENDVVDFI